MNNLKHCCLTLHFISLLIMVLLCVMDCGCSITVVWQLSNCFFLITNIASNAMNRSASPCCCCAAHRQHSQSINALPYLVNEPYAYSIMYKSSLELVPMHASSCVVYAFFSLSLILIQAGHQPLDQLSVHLLLSIMQNRRHPSCSLIAFALSFTCLSSSHCQSPP
jgi:hypothetical protein